MAEVGGATLRGRLGSWRAWNEVWAKYLGTWTTAQFVWLFDNGAWRVIWATAATAAQNAAASLEGDGTVLVTWEPDVPESVATYQIKRPSGSVAGTVSAANLASYSFTDTTPEPGSGAYTIVSKATGLPDASADTNSIDVAEPVTNVLALPSNVGVDTDITITWDASLGAQGYLIYRPDGSPLGTTAGTSIVDTNPTAGVGGYSVETSGNGVSSGVQVESNSLVLAQAPDSLNVDSVTGDDVVLSWNELVSGDYDDVQVLRGGTVLATIAAGVETYTDTNAREGTTETYTVRTRISGNAGPQSGSVTASIAPNPPVSVSCSPTATLAQLQLTWAAPAGSVSSYEVEVSEDNSVWSSVADGTSPVTHTFGGSSGVRYMRVRSIGPGATSAWVTCSGTPTWDVTPPALPTITSLKPESSYGRLVYRFTTSSSDNYQYRYRYRTNNGSWTTSGWTSTGNSSAKAIVLGTFSSTNDVDAEVQVRDVWLNTSVWSSTWRYKIKPQTQTISVTGINHNRQDTWNYAGNGYAYQGYFSSSSAQYYGFIFFGSNAIQNACNADGTGGGKVSVQSMTLRGVRRTYPGGGEPSIGNFSVPAYLGTHTKTGASGSVSSSTISNVTNMGSINNQGTTYNWTLTTAQRSALRDSAQGLGFERFSTDYFAVAAVQDLQIVSLG